MLCILNQHTNIQTHFLCSSKHTSFHSLLCLLCCKQAVALNPTKTIWNLYLLSPPEQFQNVFITDTHPKWGGEQLAQEQNL